MVGLEDPEHYMIKGQAHFPTKSGLKNQNIKIEQ